MRNKVVTVFGGSGFIGRHLVRRLARSQARVRVPARNPQRALSLKPMGAVGEIVLEPLGAGDDAALERLVAGSDMVVNLIGILHESRSQSFDAVQGELPARIGRAAVSADVERLVHLSAIGADAAALSAYARSKAAGEAGLREAFPGATILRPSVVFGPGDDFFNRFASMARISPVLPLIGGGRTRFQPVYVGDVADAIVAALTSHGAAGDLFELGGPRVYSFREILDYLLEVVHRRRWLVSLPFGLASFEARFLELLPEPLLTRDQVEMLKQDNVVGEDARGLADLGIAPTPAEVIVPTYLRRYARQGGSLSHAV